MIPDAIFVVALLLPNGKHFSKWMTTDMREACSVYRQQTRRAAVYRWDGVNLDVVKCPADKQRRG